MENEYWNDGEQKKWNILEFKDDKEVLEKIWFSKEAINFAYNAKVCQGCGQGCQYYNV